MENEMKKLDRLSKQIANVEDVDDRLAAQIRKLSQLMLQDAKFALISHRSNCSDSSSSSRNSPSAPSTPIRTMTPPPPPKKPVQSSPLSNKTSQVIFSSKQHKIHQIYSDDKASIQNSTYFLPTTR